MSRHNPILALRQLKAQSLPFLALHVLWGVALSIGALWGFLAIAEDLPEQATMVQMDVAIANWIEHHNTEWGEAIFSAVSWLGSPILAALVTMLVLTFAVRRDWLRAFGIAGTAVGGWLLNQLLKSIFHRGRPEHAGEFIHGSSWSFPSGHAMSSTVCYGFLLFLLLTRTANPLRRRVLIGGGVSLILFICASRMYLGVHYLSDVVGGCLAGISWLLASVAGYRLAERRRRPHDV